MNVKGTKNEGFVYLVGAGPGNRTVVGLSLLNHQAVGHHIVQGLFLPGKAGHNKADAQYYAGDDFGKMPA